MKLITIFMFIALMQVHAKSYSQTITLSEKNAPLEKIFTAIKTQTGYTFFYKLELLAAAKKVDIKVKNAVLNDVLAICFSDQPFTYEIVGKTIVVKQKIVAPFNSPPLMNANEEPVPPIDVKGRILDEKGAPVSGVYITVKGTSTRVVTDEFGFFTIKGIDEKATLVISAINLESREIKVEGKTDLANITVKNKIIVSDEVVIEANTGYQKIEPNKTVGSVVVIDNKTLNEQVGTNIIQRLEGVTNGLLFDKAKTAANGASNPLTIRGLSTINGNPAPLIILDNFQYEGDLNNINPNDVENITILKDAAATAIYGVRGGNGVIVITTKKAKFNQKLKVQVNSNLIVTEEPDLFYLPKMSSSDYVDLEQFLFNKGYDFNGLLNSGYSAVTPAIQIFQDRKSGKISAADSARNIDALKNIDSRRQMQKYLYSNAVVQQYSLNLRGGSNNIAWLISGSYDKSLSTLSAKSDKVNVRLSNSYRPFKNATIDFGTYYTISTTESGKSDFRSLFIRNAPYLQFADEYGTPLAIPSRYNSRLTDTLGGGKLLDWKYYPLDDYKHTNRTTRQEQIVANLGFDYKFLKYFGVNISFQYQRQFGQTRTLNDMQSFYTRNMINSYTNLNAPISSPQLRNPVPMGNILILSNTALASKDFRIQARGSKQIGNHDISGIAGFEIRESNGLGSSNQTIYGYNDNPLLFTNVDYTGNYPNLITGQIATIIGAPVASTQTVNRSVSIYSNLAYIFKNRYSFNISGKKDATNVFGLSANDKWTPLWSTGAGWDVSKEKFYKFSQIPRLRLKMTIGYSGNVDLSRSPIPTINFPSITSAAGFPIARIRTPENKLLRWERVKQINFGADFSTKNNILSGTIEYYLKKGIDLYGPAYVDRTAWISPQIIKNIADIKGHGFDIQLQTKNIDRNLKWFTTFTFNYSIIRTVKYYSYNTDNISLLKEYDGNRITPIIGKPLYAIAALRWGGLDKLGNPQGFINGQLSTDYNAIVNNSNINNKDIIYKGSTSPLYFGYVTNRLTWKKISATVNIVYKGGYYFKKTAISYYNIMTSGTTHGDYAKRWQKPGDENHTNIPSFIYPSNSFRDLFYQQSEINILRGDHIRLQYINMVYTLNKKIELYLNASNLGILWRANKEKIDPELSSSATFPSSKSYAVGIRCNL